MAITNFKEGNFTVGYDATSPDTVTADENGTIIQEVEMPNTPGHYIVLARVSCHSNGEVQLILDPGGAPGGLGDYDIVTVGSGKQAATLFTPIDFDRPTPFVTLNGFGNPSEIDNWYIRLRAQTVPNETAEVSARILIFRGTDYKIS